MSAAPIDAAQGTGPAAPPTATAPPGQPPRRAYAPRLPREQRREQLLDAALDIALERGFHAVTIDGVARAAGVTRPVVYGLFADSTALLASLIERAEQRSLAQLSEMLPDLPGPGEQADPADPDALIVAGIRVYLSAIAADPRTWRVILVPPDGAPAELALRINANRRLLLHQLRALCDWGLPVRGGPLLDADLFARAVFTLAEGAARLILEDPDRWPVEHFVEFTRAALKGLHS